MTCSFLSYEKDDIRAYWNNDGTLLICVKKGEPRCHICVRPEGGCFYYSLPNPLDEHVHVLPSELKTILQNGEWMGEEALRPGMFSRIGHVESAVVDDMITVVEYNIVKSEATLSKQEWQDIYDACVTNRNQTVKEWGGMIEPLVGKSSWKDEVHD